ncbi:hypothetical protein VULLAG_LOCUS10536 [Vulpes lagopus]
MALSQIFVIRVAESDHLQLSHDPERSGSPVTQG